MSKWEELQKTGKTKVKGVTDKISTKDVQKVLSGSDWEKKIARLRGLAKLAKKGVKQVPLIGGLAAGAVAGLTSGDASAAIPILGEAEPLGPEQGSIEATIEDPEASMDERRQALRELSKRYR